VPLDNQPMPAHDPIELVHQEIRRSRPDLAELERIARRLRRSPENLCASLDALLCDAEAAAVVASRSSLHPNGFAKVVLRVGDGYGIRLHIWDRANRSRAGDSNPHGHRWEFASWVVAGALRETTFAEAPESESFELSSYSRDANGKPNLTTIGSAALRPVEEIDRSAGDVYSRTRSVLHTVVPVGSDLVASLVLQRPPARDATAVFRRPGKSLDDDEHGLTTDELRALIKDLALAIR
jgi:hypothetical protein